MSHRSLEDVLQAAGDPVSLARNSQIGPYVYPSVPAEFANWRDEQVAWRETCALLDQSHHMTDLTVEGPDAIRLSPSWASTRSRTSRSTRPSSSSRAITTATSSATRSCSTSTRTGSVSWAARRRTTGSSTTHRPATTKSPCGVTSGRRPTRPGGASCTATSQAPAALDVLEKAARGPLPDVKFFNMGVIQVAGRTVRALHHGMSGAPGLELFGPWEEAEEVKAAIVEAGSDFGLRQVGARVYATNTLESGWIPSPLPAVFTGEEMRAYRQWLPADGYEATGSLGGSFSSDDITDLYLTPHDLGYWSLTKLDHDFIGREALESLGDKHERRKVTLARNGDDVRRAMGTMFAKGDPVKYIDLPLSNYATWPYDKVLLNGDVVGVSTFSGYSYNERSMLSLAVLDSDVPIGAEVTLVWGEAGGGSAKPVVERHVQAEFRAVVSPCPYSEVIRASYGGESRRTRATVA